ncbi:NAD(P)-binding protein [Obba rivulosa]|uniref:NAD(P)-binding protein n=1 Tax=Obba rivulosa TaxID=1052685 RepID=A0A8E2AK89_9APHY|nr:NAD(P)-binding protein [Obba rivulosa]
MSEAARPLVLVVGGATGKTGRSIVDALLKDGGFRVAVTCRPSSLSKPPVAELRSQGVDVRVADIEAYSLNELRDLLSDVDVLISTVIFELIREQKPLLIAAKDVGVKRVIPCDFGTPGKRGVRDLHDAKLYIRDFVKQLGIGYTFIDVGWWMQLALPYRSTSQSPRRIQSHEVYGGGDKKMLLTNLDHIGDYVARIVADERTLNQYVIVWEDEVTQLQAREIGERVSGDDALKTSRIYVSADEIRRRAREGKAEFLRNHSRLAELKWVSYQYQHSMHVLGENSLATAKALGALDVRELYPDIVAMTLEEYAQEFYEREPFAMG